MNIINFEVKGHIHIDKRLYNLVHKVEIKPMSVFWSNLAHVSCNERMNAIALEVIG